ncbi:MAG TPA: replicative DNA helicase [Geobacteraceae bacterium]|nr:replicative DNA helicase [Geobacteraceae bacterium]
MTQEIRALEAERSVIGAVLIDAAALPAVMDILKPSDFDAAANQRILEAIIALSDRGQPADITLLSEELRQKGALEKIGGRLYLAGLLEETPSAANVEHYARIVKDRSITRSLCAAARRIIERAGSANGDGAEELLSFAQKEVMAVSSAISGSPGQEMNELIRRTHREIEERWQSGDTLPGLSTGFPSLDAITGGLKPGLLYVFAGRPGTGKTALALNVSRCAAGSGCRVLFLSLEMPGTELSLRLLSAESGIDGHRLSRGMMGPEEWAQSVKAAVAASALPMTIDDTGGLPIDRLTARARRLKMEKGLSLIVVDYLQLLRPSQKWNTREQEVSEASRSLKALAKELAVPVIACAQLNRAIESRIVKHHTLADLRESGAIEQDADVIAFLSTADDVGELVELSIAKHRQGPTGKISLRFDRKRTRFAEQQRANTSGAP